MGRRNGTAAVEGGAKEAQFGGLQYVPSKMPFHPHAFQTCLPHPWQERPPRARTSPPGGWSSPVKRTCQQTAGFQTISYFIRWLTKVIVHRLLLHPWGNNLWDDAWRHKNRLREGIFGEYEELAIVKNAANKPAQHSRGDIRLGEKGAEA